MREMTEDTFLNSLKIQGRVIHALFMREIITRYGRHNLGFAWLFVEPMIFTLGVAGLWYATKSAHGSDLPIVPFAVIGYSVVLLWRNVAGRAGGAVQANIGLLYHRNVRLIDVYIARSALEIIGATISLMTLSIIFNIIGLMSVPTDFLYMVFGWFLLIWFALALGFVVGPLFEMSEIVNRLWHAFTYLMFPLSGAGFFVYWLPEMFQKIVLYVPMVHFSEMIKHGYYGDLVPTFESIRYIIIWNIGLSFLGLYLVRYTSNKLEAHG